MSASLLLYPRKMALTRGIVPHTRANSYQSPVNHSGILSMDIRPIRCRLFAQPIDRECQTAHARSAGALTGAIEMSRTTLLSMAAILSAAPMAFAQQAHVNLDWNLHKNTQNLNPFGANVISPEVKDDR